MFYVDNKAKIASLVRERCDGINNKSINFINFLELISTLVNK